MRRPLPKIESQARSLLAKARPERKLAAASAAVAAAAAAAGVGLRRIAARDEPSPTYTSSAYRLLDGEPFGPGLKRIALARVDHALAELSGESGEDPDEAVHEARKDVKKVRAVVRLVRDPLGEDLYKRENRHYREIGRSLGGFRDAEAMVETMDALGERFGPAAVARFAGLRRRFESELDSHHGDGSREAAMASAARALAEGRGRVVVWPLEAEGWELVGAGLHRTYRRGRKGLRGVQKEASDEHLHEWRKRVKDLWYQLRLLRGREPDLLGRIVRDADDLADHLGDDHDLALLSQALPSAADAFEEPGDRRLLAELIDRRRGELQFAAIGIGLRLYADKPKRFIKQLQRHVV